MSMLAAQVQTRSDITDLPRIAGRNTLMELSSPADPVTILNLPFDALGNVFPRAPFPRERDSVWLTYIRVRGRFRAGFA